MSSRMGRSYDNNYDQDDHHNRRERHKKKEKGGNHTDTQENRCLATMERSEGDVKQKGIDDDSFDSNEKQDERRFKKQQHRGAGDGEEDDDDNDDNDRRKRKNKRYRGKDYGDNEEDYYDSRGKKKSHRRHRGGNNEYDDDDDHHRKNKSKKRDDDNGDDEDRHRSSSSRKSKDRGRHDRDESPGSAKRRRRDRERSKKSESRSRKSRKREPSPPPVASGGLVSLGAKFGKPPPVLIDPIDDYFQYHQHLWVYLFREEGKFFNDLTSAQAHEAFARFAERFNRGDLEASYYCNNGLPQDAIDECRTTGHVWSFSTNEKERQNLQLLQEGVRKQTEYDNQGGNAAAASISDKDDPLPALTSSKPEFAAVAKKSGREGTPIVEERGSNRRLRDLIRTAEEELTGGRKDGRERQLEAKKELSAKIHGAARDKEETTMGGMELGDDALYGDGGVNFQAALALERQRASRRQEEKEKRIADLQKKDQEKQKAMLEKLGLTGIKPGQKITIPPRKDEP